MKTMTNEEIYGKEREILTHSLDLVLQISEYLNDLDCNRGEEDASAGLLPQLYGVDSALLGALRSVEYYHHFRAKGEK